MKATIELEVIPEWLARLGAALGCPTAESGLVRWLEERLNVPSKERTDAKMYVVVGVKFKGFSED